MRFLIKDMDIDENIQKKWFQTPGSYTASQLRCVWKFDTNVEKYLTDNLGKSLHKLFDETIQKKRNASAHFNGNSVVQGRDCIEIKKIYEVLSNVFLFSEVKTFVYVICEELHKIGYTDFKIFYFEDVGYDVDQFSVMINEFAKQKQFFLTCKRKTQQEYGIFFTKEGCQASIKDDSKMWKQKVEIINDRQHIYQFFEHKGYYQNSQLFLETVIDKWSEIE